jgi:hypothetical protein
MNDEQLVKLPYVKRVTFLLQMLGRFYDKANGEKNGSKRMAALDKVIAEVTVELIRLADERPLIK